MRRLIWGFAGSTYRIVGNLMSRLKYIIFLIFRKVGRSLTWLILGMPVAPDLVWQDVGDLDPNYLQNLKAERERERETSVCIQISCNLETYHVSVLKMLLVRNSFCTTKSDTRQYWCFACFLSHAQMFKLTKHSFLNSIRIWSVSELLTTFFSLLF